MPRAIDFHVHLPIAEFMDVAIGKHRAGAEAYFLTRLGARFLLDNSQTLGNDPAHGFYARRIAG
jgi:hypothetical protein